ncbi:MAG: RDD family protein [Acidobacteria bacterium]|nr:RDD family protein [Acidobacteriota bacterium]
MNTSTRHEEMTPATSAAQPPPGREAGPPPSTLIEFPRPGRTKPPQWRKDLSERVREIQQRRALEAARDAEDAALADDAAGRDGLESAAAAAEAAAPQLGLVPTPEPAEVNPILVKALERIERARRQNPQAAYGQPARAAAAQAAARLPEETRQPDQHEARASTADAPAAAPQAAAAEPAPAEEIEPTAEPVRATTLVVVPTPAPPDTEAGAAIREALSRPRPRRHLPQVADDALLLRREAEVAPAFDEQTERAAEPAPPARRVAAAAVDLLVVAFASSPFAAIIELTSGNWHDPRVAASLGGIVLTIMFLYETVSVAFSGRTWGMALFSLRAGDSRTGLIPTTGQCARRALLHILSLATLGVPLLLALFGSEGRTAHDHLSRTAVVKE